METLLVNLSVFFRYLVRAMLYQSSCLPALGPGPFPPGAQGYVCAAVPPSRAATFTKNRRKGMGMGPIPHRELVSEGSDAHPLSLHIIRGSFTYLVSPKPCYEWIQPISFKTRIPSASSQHCMDSMNHSPLLLFNSHTLFSCNMILSIHL